MAVPRGATPPAPPAPEVLALYASVLRDLELRADELVSAIAARIVERIPALANDERLLQAIERTSRTNIRTAIDLLADPGLPLDAPAAAVAIAGAYVRSGQPLSILIETYHVGQAMFFDTWLESLAAATDDGRLLASATLESYRRVCAYLDAVLARVVEQYLADRQQWQARRLRRQWQIVQNLLAGTLAEPQATASSALGYDLGRVHAAAIVASSAPSERRDEEGLDSTSLVEVARALAQHLGAGRTLLLEAGPGLVYAWIPVADTTPPAIARFEAPPGVRVAVGAAHRGPDGFRASHQQALRVHQLLRHAQALPAVAAYADVAALCLLRDEPAHLRDFVAQQLLALRRRDPETGVLRQTLQVALAEGLNASGAARRLGVHKNTVLYRLRIAEELLGRPLAESRLELELALRIIDVYGDDMLGPELAA